MGNEHNFKLKNFFLQYYILISITTLVIIVRMLILIYGFDKDKYYFQDTIHYYSAAVELTSSGTFGINPESKHEKAFGLEPAYSLVISTLIFFFGKGYLAIRIFQNIIYILSSIYIYKTLRLFTCKKLSLLGMLFYLLYPYYIFLSNVVLPEGLYTPLLVVMVYYMLIYVKFKKNKAYYIFSGLLAISIHLKVTSLGLVPLLLVPFFSGEPMRIILKKISVGTSIIILISMPWAVRNYIVFNRLTLPRNYWTENNKTETTKLIEKYGKTLSISRLYENSYNLLNPSITRIRGENKFNNSFTKIASIISTLPLLMCTGILLLIAKRNKLLYLVYVFLILYLVPYIIIAGQTRYRIPIDFIMIILTIVCISNIIRVIKHIKIPRLRVFNK